MKYFMAYAATIKAYQWWIDMVKKIDIKKLGSLTDLKEMIKQVENESDQYFFTQDDKILACLVPPGYFDALLNEDSKNMSKEIDQRKQARQKVLQFMRELREYNQDIPADEIQADIEEAISAVRQTEMEKVYFK
ncbi:MAG: hypothetical protein ACT6FF_06475 [Methanosarcinaceae archaeon]